MGFGQSIRREELNLQPGPDNSLYGGVDLVVLHRCGFVVDGQPESEDGGLPVCE